MDAFSENVDPLRDMPTERPLNVDENDFVIKQKPEDPYGFWWISRQKGQVPETLKGAYTTPGDATKAVTVYLNSVKKKK